MDGFLELQWEAYGSSRLATGTSGNRLCCFREVKAPFKLRAVTLECSRVTAEEWDLMSHWEVIWWCFLLCGYKTLDLSEDSSQIFKNSLHSQGLFPLGFMLVFPCGMLVCCLLILGCPFVFMHEILS